MFLPKKIDKVKVPPLKIQGIKTKLVPFIAYSIEWDGKGTYFEPFMGSGVVGFNLAPQNALFTDTNPHIIKFYKNIQNGNITSEIVREYLEIETEKLKMTPPNKDSYYYEVRKRFNEKHCSLDFLFLQRSNFNGMMRFNSKGGYNVPFGRKPERFSKSLITKIVNQVAWVEEMLKNKNWDFKVMSFEEVIELMGPNDFMYLDPPYVNRYDGYYDSWGIEKANYLAEKVIESNAGYALSMWYKNKYRENDHLEQWSSGVMLTTEHFYHVGAKSANRSSMIEALVVKKGFVNSNIDE